MNVSKLWRAWPTSIKHPKGYSKPLSGSVCGWLQDFLQTPDLRMKGAYTRPELWSKAPTCILAEGSWPYAGRHAQGVQGPKPRKCLVGSKCCMEHLWHLCLLCYLMLVLAWNDEFSWIIWLQGGREASRRNWVFLNLRVCSIYNVKTNSELKCFIYYQLIQPVSIERVNLTIQYQMIWSSL